MLKELQVHHREIARLKFEGFTPKEIADRTGKKLQTVYNILRDSLCKAYMNGLADKADKTVINVRQSLAEMNIDALKAMKDLLSPGNNTPAPTLLMAAKDVLDRNGYKAPERHEHLHGHFTSADLATLKDRAENAKRLN